MEENTVAIAVAEDGTHTVKFSETWIKNIVGLSAEQAVDVKRAICMMYGAGQSDACRRAKFAIDHAFDQLPELGIQTTKLPSNV